MSETAVDRRARLAAEAVATFTEPPSTLEVAAALGVHWNTADDHLHHAQVRGLVTASRGPRPGRMSYLQRTVWVPRTAAIGAARCVAGECGGCLYLDLCPGPEGGAK